MRTIRKLFAVGCATAAVAGFSLTAVGVSSAAAGPRHIDT
jgi:hypothetical protein